MANEKKGLPWLGIGLAAGALALIGMASKAKAETTPLQPWEDPATDRKAAAQKMTDELHAILTAKGYSTFPSYETATGATEGISRPTGAFPGTQADYETWYHFMWQTNDILKFNNLNPADDAIWAAYIAQYQKALAMVSSL